MAGSFTAMFLALPAPFPAGATHRGDNVAENENDEVPKLPPDARLESLDKRLDKLQQAEAKRTARRQPDPNYQSGQLVLSQLVGAPLGGGIVGWLLDHWLGTKPWLMVVMIFLGFAVGIWNVIRISNEASGKARDERD